MKAQPLFNELMAAVGACLLGGAIWWDWTGWSGAGLDPTASGQGATVFALLAFQACTAVIAAIMAPLSFGSNRSLSASSSSRRSSQDAAWNSASLISKPIPSRRRNSLKWGDSLKFSRNT